MTFRTAPVLLLLAACTGTTAPPPVGEDTDTGDNPNVLPIDTSFFVPRDTSPDQPPNLTPQDFLFIRHAGTWELSGTPIDTINGTLKIVEEVNGTPVRDTSVTGDTTPIVFDCEVDYALTGTAVDNSTCGARCDYVFEVEYFLNEGALGACRQPDLPAGPNNGQGVVWQLGYDADTNEILYNYYGTDVWVKWYDVDPARSDDNTLVFEWFFTLALELEDTAMP